MRCEQIMNQDVQSARPTDTVADAARKMQDAGVGFLPVCDELDRVIGVLTDRDIALRVCAEDRRPGGTKVGEVMTRQVIACRPWDTIHHAEQLMSRHLKSRIVLTDHDGRLAGVVSLSDIALSDESPHAVRLLRAVASRERRPPAPA